MMNIDQGTIDWRHIVLGNSWETYSTSDRADFLESLATSDGRVGIWFDRTTNDDDEELVLEILAAIRRNPNVVGITLQSLSEKFPADWLCDMLRSGNIEELRIMSGNIVDVERGDQGVKLTAALAKCSSLKTLCVDYPSAALWTIVNLALENSQTLKLEVLDIAGFSQVGYIILTPLLPYCSTLKKLILTRGSNVDLDTQHNGKSLIDEFVNGLANLPHLKTFTFGFGHSTPAAYNKLVNALVDKDLKFLSIGASEHQVVLDDPVPLQRMFEANRNLERIHMLNVQTKNMSGMFSAFNHEKLKEVTLVNVLKYEENARALSNALSRNTTPIEHLEIYQQGNFEHEPFVRALSDGLRDSQSLTNVRLQLTQVYDIDLHAVAVVLESNNQLKRLTVSQYRGTSALNLDSGLTRLGQSLIHNKTLTSLHLNFKASICKEATEALISGVKINSTLKSVEAAWLSNKEQAQLSFYLDLNRGAKQSLYLPLSLMPYAFARADKCRVENAGRRPIRVDLLADAVRTGTTNDFTEVMRRVFVRDVLGVGEEASTQEEGQLAPPNELYFFVRERCDLFQLSVREDVNNGSSGTSWWCCGLFGGRR